MTERIMNVEALPAYFIAAFQAKQVRVCENGGRVTIEVVTQVEPRKIAKDGTLAADSPLRGTAKVGALSNGKTYSCPFLGTAKGGTLTVDKFLEMKRAEKELEDANDARLRS